MRASCQPRKPQRAYGKGLAPHGFLPARLHGARKPNIELDIACGGYWEKVTNRCLLRAPDEGPGSERVLTASFQAQASSGARTASNPEHVALSERVGELLDRAGLLKELQPEPGLSP